ncbi:MAG: AtpZ/AtpI family protein [Verrucomicrobiia bacterium]
MWRCAAVGTDMVAATFVGAGIGWWLDNRFGTSPWLLVLFFLLGSGAGMLMVYRRFKGNVEDRR